MAKIIEEALYSKGLVETLDRLLQIGIDDDVGATMFSGTDVGISEDGKRIVVEIKPNPCYFENMAKNGKEIGQWKKLDAIIN